VLVTGTGSFIGEAFRKRAALFPGQYEVGVLSLRGEDWRAADFSRYDAVLHVAGLAHVKYNEAMRDRYMAVNRDLAIEAAEKAKADGCVHFLFLSSMIVYGPPARAGHTRTIGPDTLPAPENAYGESKLQAERGILALADENFRVAILRLPTVYGKGCKGSYATLSRWAGKLPAFPDIAGARSVLYVENLAEFIRLLIDDRAEGFFFPQNAAYSSATELMREIARVRGEKIAFTRLFNPVLRLLGASTFIRKAFGGISYDREMSAYPREYRVAGFSESIRRTEE
jgi:UDP-glucose 4-epimerase